MTQLEAVRLFVERASFARPSFAVTSHNASAIAQICWRLDGIPLAVELAAARVKTLPVEQLVTRLEDGFRLLVGGSRTALPRQQTLDATVKWSYDLLDERERGVFGRLSVFAGGCSLEAAEVVCAGRGVEADEVLDLLTSLVDKLLVTADEVEGGEARYRLLETLRDYARRRLADSGEADETRRRHCAYYRELVERAEPELRGFKQADWLRRLSLDDGNVRLAIRWLAERGDIRKALRMAGALWPVWDVRGLWTEGRSTLSELLAEALPDGSGTPEVAARARALQGAGALAFYQGDYLPSRMLLEESLGLFRSIGDKRGAAWSLIYLGWMTNDSGDPTGAIPLAEEALSLAREAGDQLAVSWALARIGLASEFLGQFGRAIEVLGESLRLSRSLGDRWGTAWALLSLGFCQVYSPTPEPGVAERLEIEAIAIWRELEGRRDLALSLGILGVAGLLQGKVAETGRLWREMLQLQLGIGDTWGMIQAVALSAALAVEQGQPERALRLDGAAGALAEATGVPVAEVHANFTSPYLGRAREALGPTAAEAARAEGQAMALEQAVEYALKEEG